MIKSFSKIIYLGAFVSGEIGSYDSKLRNIGGGRASTLLKRLELSGGSSRWRCVSESFFPHLDNQLGVVQAWMLVSSMGENHLSAGPHNKVPSSPTFRALL